MTERIDHAAEAQKHIEWAHTQQESDGEYEFSVRDNAILAQAEATLALVEQQRLANLIALAAIPGTGTLETAAAHALLIPADDAEWESRPTIRPEIREGLGL